MELKEVLKTSRSMEMWEGYGRARENSVLFCFHSHDCIFKVLHQNIQHPRPILSVPCNIATLLVDYEYHSFSFQLGAT